MVRFYVYVRIYLDMQTKLEISKHTVNQQSRAMADKEREAVRRVQ